jgi:hypothetical protein
MSHYVGKLVTYICLTYVNQHPVSWITGGSNIQIEKTLKQQFQKAEKYIRAIDAQPTQK